VEKLPTRTPSLAAEATSCAKPGTTVSLTGPDSSPTVADKSRAQLGALQKAPRARRGAFGYRCDVTMPEAGFITAAI
jgi:hypothetical protein